jgi:hypothetical protein
MATEPIRDYRHDIRRSAEAGRSLSRPASADLQRFGH